MTAKTKQSKRHTGKVATTWWQPPHGYLAVCAVILICAVVSFGAYAVYHDRTLPGITVGNVAVANMDAAQLKEVVKNEAADLKVTFMYDGKSMTVPASDLGVQVNVDQTVKDVMLSRRSTNIAQNLAFWEQHHVPLSYANDAGMLKAYIVAHFPQLYVDPQDAQLVYNPDSKQFDVQPGVPGRGFDIKKFESQLPDLAKDPRTVELPLTTVPVEPLINDLAAVKAQEEANKKLASAISFTQNGEVKYQLTPDDISNWIHFNPDLTKGSLSVEFDKAIIDQFISTKVAGAITTLPVDRKVAIDTISGDSRVIQVGSKGYQIEDTDKLADDVMDALEHNKELTKEVTVTEAPFKTVTVSGAGKWIEVDLSSQTLNMYIGNEVVAHYLISSGKAATPTEIGTFKIYAKYPMQTMTGTINGEYYYVPNIKWVSYFDDGEALHGTYWHHNFGHPMSHGCINMTETDAKTLYDFAPIGTKVVVHA